MNIFISRKTANDTLQVRVTAAYTENPSMYSSSLEGMKKWRDILHPRADPDTESKREDEYLDRRESFWIGELVETVVVVGRLLFDKE